MTLDFLDFVLIFGWSLHFKEFRSVIFVIYAFHLFVFHHCQYDHIHLFLFLSTLGVIVVKKPSGSRSVLDDKRNLGQIYDYMRMMESFYAISTPIGVLTTYNEWRVCWIDSSDEFARSRSLLDASIPSSPLDESMPIMERDDPNITEVITEDDHAER